MLTRQKIVLALLKKADMQLSRTVFVKLMFLLRHETQLAREPSFYDFVPYKYGPFSFSLYWELGSLRQNGYVVSDPEQMAIPIELLGLASQKTDELPKATIDAVTDILVRYGRIGRRALLERIYAKYPWYASRSERGDSARSTSRWSRRAPVAIYTVGYEGISVDFFFDRMLRVGIERVIDVRANAVSRRYGFSRKHLASIAGKVGMDYRHVPALGIPSEYRAGIGKNGSYRRLFDWYERNVLSTEGESIRKVAQLMKERPTVLLCMERDAQRCHRNRLAQFISEHEDLDIKHL